MKAQTSYLDLEKRNGLVYEIGLPNPFTGLVRVPFVDFTGKEIYSKSQQDYVYESAKAEGKEFLSTCLFTYEDEAFNSDVDSILDLRSSRGEELLEDFVCEFRYKSGLKHGISRELILVGHGYDGGCWLMIEETFIGGKCAHLTLYYLLRFNVRIFARGCCNENFMVGFDTTYEFPDEVKEGLWEYYDTNGNLEKTETYKDGRLWVSYYGNGQLKTKENWKDGIKDGLMEGYHDNGQLMSKENWKDGKEDGLWVSYYDNGQLRSEENWKDGEREDGLQEGYYNNGKLESKQNWKDGEPDGLWEGYLTNGQLWFKENYKDGKKEGLWEIYHLNGQLGLRVNYKKGKSDGLEERYYSNGKKMFKRNYKNGIPDGRGKWYDENGQLKTLGSLLNSGVDVEIPSYPMM